MAISIPEDNISSRSSRLRVSPWFIWGLGAAFFFAEYFARVSPSVMVPDLMREFGVTATALGSLSAFFYYAYISMQLPVGMLVDRYGPHKLLTVTALICMLGALLFGRATNIFAADMGRLLMGFGAAFAFVGSLKLAAVWFPAKRFGLLAGLTQAIGMLGAAFGEAPMAVLVTAVGWREAMLLIAGIFLILGVLIGIFVRDFPTDYPRSRIKAREDLGLLQSLKIVLKTKSCWINGAFAGFLYAPTAAFAEMWGVSFLSRVYHLSTDKAALAVSLIFIGWGIGSPLMGWFSDKIQKRKPVMYVSSILSMLFLGLVLYVPSIPVSMVFVLLFLYGMSNTAVATSYAVASELTPRLVAGTSMAFANMASVLVGSIMLPVIGWILDMQWNGVKVNGVPYYTAHDYHIALISLPVLLLVSCILVYFVPETHAKPLAE